MEKGQGPHTEMPAPPYPGLPLDYNAGASQHAGQNVFPTPSYPGPPMGSQPTPMPGVQPTAMPGVQPTAMPGVQPTAMPGVKPTAMPVVQPAVQPVSQVVVMQNHLPRDVSGQMKCAHCQAEVVTTTEHKFGLLTWTLFGVLLIIGCWPCCLIPFCVKDCHDVEHCCPRCNRVIHIHKRM